MICGINTALVSADDQKIVAFKLNVGGNGRGVTAQFCTLEGICLWILKFTGRPYDVLCREGALIKVKVEQSVMLLDGVYVGVFQNRDFEKRDQVVEVLRILLAGGVFHFHAERR